MGNTAGRYSLEGPLLRGDYILAKSGGNALALTDRARGAELHFVLTCLVEAFGLTPYYLIDVIRHAYRNGVFERLFA